MECLKPLSPARSSSTQSLKQMMVNSWLPDIAKNFKSGSLTWRRKPHIKKSDCHLHTTLEQRLKAVYNLRFQHDIKMLCRVLAINRTATPAAIITIQDLLTEPKQTRWSLPKRLLKLSGPVTLHIWKQLVNGTISAL